MRIGRLLVEEGLITVEQLEAGLRTSERYGGRLGSNLAELGMIELDVLARVLAKQLGVPAAMQKHFDAIDRDSIKLLPPRVAAQRLAMPLGWSQKQAKTLIVAFVNPHDLAAVDEVANITRARLQVCVAPEARIRAALTQHYNIRSESRQRFVDVDPTAPRAPIESEPPVSKRAPQPARVTPPTPRVLLSMPPSALDTPDAPPVSAERPVARITIDTLLRALEDATTRDRIGDATTEFLAPHFRTALLLIVKDGAALGWKGFAGGVDKEVIESVAIPLGSPSVIRTAYETKTAFVGAPPAEGAPAMSRVYKLLRTEAPKSAIAMPVVVMGRVVNILYGHGGEITPSLVDDLHRACNAMRDAYVRILRARVSSG